MGSFADREYDVDEPPGNESGRTGSPARYHRQSDDKRAATGGRSRTESPGVAAVRRRIGSENQQSEGRGGLDQLRSQRSLQGSTFQRESDPQRAVKPEQPLWVEPATARAERQAIATEERAVMHPTQSTANRGPVRLVDRPTRNESPVDQTDDRILEAVRSVREKPGTPLPTSVRSRMERRFGGADFSDVRIHTGPAANRSAATLDAHAYTIGTEIIFSRDGYDPSTRAGTGVLAHELAHVRQQRLAQHRVQRMTVQEYREWMQRIVDDEEDEENWADSVLQQFGSASEAIQQAIAEFEFRPGVANQILSRELSEHEIRTIGPELNTLDATVAELLLENDFTPDEIQERAPYLRQYDSDFAQVMVEARWDVSTITTWAETLSRYDPSFLISMAEAGWTPQQMNTYATLLDGFDFLVADTIVQAEWDESTLANRRPSMLQLPMETVLDVINLPFSDQVRDSLFALLPSLDPDAASRVPNLSEDGYHISDTRMLELINTLSTVDPMVASEIVLSPMRPTEIIDRTPVLGRWPPDVAVAMARANWDLDTINQRGPAINPYPQEIAAAMVIANWDLDTINQRGPTLNRYQPEIAAAMVRGNWDLDTVNQRGPTLNRYQPEIAAAMVRGNWDLDTVNQRGPVLNQWPPEVAEALVAADWPPQMIQDRAHLLRLMDPQRTAGLVYNFDTTIAQVRGYIRHVSPSVIDELERRNYSEDEIGQCFLWILGDVDNPYPVREGTFKLDILDRATLSLAVRFWRASQRVGDVVVSKLYSKNVDPQTLVTAFERLAEMDPLDAVNVADAGWTCEQIASGAFTQSQSGQNVWTDEQHGQLFQSLSFITDMRTRTQILGELIDDDRNLAYQDAQRIVAAIRRRKENDPAVTNDELLRIAGLTPDEAENASG